MKPTNTKDPNFYHKVVDCQWACPAHTPVPEYIRLIAAGRYTDAYMVNWVSNVFPGVLGRVCDRPCEPACRRGRTDEEPVAICRLKRVAYDYKDDISDRMPDIPKQKNGKRIALLGAGPASLAVARDLAPLGYSLTVFDREIAGGGMMRSQIPVFRLPETVLNEEVNRILDLGVESYFQHDVTSLKAILDQNFDAIVVGTGAPAGRDLNLPGRKEADANIHIGVNWLSGVNFEHIDSIGKRVIVLGGGNTAMDCCRTSRRLGGDDVKVVVRSGFDEMKASPWEKEDAIAEDIPIINNHVPKEFVVENGRLVAMLFEKVNPVFDENGKRSLVPTGDPLVRFDCDDVIVAIGQDNAYQYIEKDLGIDFNERGMPVLDRSTFGCSHPKVFFVGDASFGPTNIIEAVAQGHEVAISVDLLCNGKDISKRPPPDTVFSNQKMGVHEWSYDNDIDENDRYQVPHAEKDYRLSSRKIEVELGFDPKLGFDEAQRCLNCDVQTVFSAELCTECDACMDICPTDCITFTPNAEEEALRTQFLAPADNLDQALLISSSLNTGRIMAKNEDVCLHCGLCAERCPTNAWDMHKFLFNTAKATEVCKT